MRNKPCNAAARLTLALTCLLSTTGTGCDALLGISNYTFGDSMGSSSTEGTTTTSDSSGGTTSVGGGGGPGGMAGTGGVGAMGGTGGACDPKTCADLAKTCGNAFDGCGKMLDCDNHVKDENETDTDCGGGGSCATLCASGKLCKLGTDCTSTFCADGVCCDDACGGVCQACTAGLKGQGVDGACGPIEGGSDPDMECVDEGGATCGTDGFCDGAGACEQYATGTECGPQSCSGSTQTDASSCDGNGTCVSGSDVGCGAYVCKGASCAANCMSSADCVAPATCIGNMCKGPCVTGLAAGVKHTCARKVDGTLWCWGYNLQGQIGDGTTDSPKPSPVQVTSLGTSAAKVAGGHSHTCASKGNGKLWCWGNNQNGQLGDGTTDSPKPSPIQVTSLGMNVAGIAAGQDHTCAWKVDGTLWCWGFNLYGQLGDGTTDSPKPSPIQVTSLGTDVVEVSTGDNHTCARKTDGTLWCWGYNLQGQIGDGTTDSPKPSPIQVTSLGTDVVEVSAGGTHTCARKGDGTLWCWGWNAYGQVGNGTTNSPKPSPVQVTLGASAVEVSAGDNHTCARKGDGTLWCWGWNLYGQIGDGTIASPKPSPVQVTLGASAVEVSTGAIHTCARKGDGTLWCWGNNEEGQLGDGTIASPKPSPGVALLSCP